MKAHGRLILVRHGQSIWNRQNRFTGWVDVSLSPTGILEAEKAGDLLKDYAIDAVYTSALLRAQNTAYEILKRNQYAQQYIRIQDSANPWYQQVVPTEEPDQELYVHVSEQLNERHYGDLQGMNKTTASELYGKEQLHLWRRSYDIPPPQGESLKMTAERVLPYYHASIEPELKKGKTLLICAHGNSLRALVMFIEKLSPEQIMVHTLATGVPYIYHFNTELNLVDKETLAGNKPSESQAVSR
ncbi:MAG: 2,3-bisphosphoglycerate-dependent phosphoglycerate mutase [Proteobacteria bacterium]|nr:2,3-bisphosphoglycerate-dependent phosphoglycerate mutase [Pseudomonadota bacterium]